VWANTCTTKGLVGRSDLALNTAVGVPMCSIGNDLYVLILFSLESIRMSQHAMEFLCSSARIVSEPSCCFLPASLSTVVTPAKVEQFVGLWDMVELMDAYSEEVAFESLSLGRLQCFFDNQESTSLKCIFNDFKQIHNSGFTSKQLESLQKMNLTTSGLNEFTGERDRAGSMASYESGNSSSWSIALKQLESSRSAGDSKMLLPFTDNLASGAFTVAFDGCTGSNTSEEAHDSDSVTSSSLFSGSRQFDCFSDYDSMSDRYVSVPIIDVRQSYKNSHSRFHEFMVALMGMTIFDAAELWLLSDISKDMCVVAALHRNGVMGMWTEQSRSMRISRSVDVPGHVLESGNPYWDQYYDQHSSSDPLHPRALLASTLHVRTAFAIPLPGADGVGGVLALYSGLRVDVDLVLVSYVAKALQLLSASTIDSEILAQIDIETVMGVPRRQLEKWHVELPSSGTEFAGDMPTTASVTTVHSASRVNGAITLTIVSESQTGEGSATASPANTVFTISPMGSLANPQSELATLHAQYIRSGRSLSSERGKHRRIGERDRDGVSETLSASGFDGSGSRALFGCRMERIRGPALTSATYRGIKQHFRQQSMQFQNKVVNDPSFQFSAPGAAVLNGYSEFQKLQQLSSQGHQSFENGSNKKMRHRGTAGNGRPPLGGAVNSGATADHIPASANFALQNPYSHGGQFDSRIPFSRRFNLPTIEELSTPQSPQTPQSPSINDSASFMFGGNTSQSPLLQYGGSVASMAPSVHIAPEMGELDRSSGRNRIIVPPVDELDRSFGRNRPIVTASGELDRSSGRSRYIQPANGDLDKSSGRTRFGAPALGELDGSTERSRFFVPASGELDRSAPGRRTVSPAMEELDRSASGRNKRRLAALEEEAKEALVQAAQVAQAETDSAPSRLDTLVALSTLFQINEAVPLGMCRVVGCSAQATTKLANLCSLHASSRRCAANDCNKCAQGGTGYCIAHGGGRRCTFPGCYKGARDKFFCAGHGGGKVISVFKLLVARLDFRYRDAALKDARSRLWGDPTHAPLMEVVKGAVLMVVLALHKVGVCFV
jgi:hypothetical protein